MTELESYVADMRTAIKLRRDLTERQTVRIRALTADLNTALGMIRLLHEACPEEHEGCELCKFTTSVRKRIKP